MLNRALLYLKRRKHRSLLLFLLLSSIALCLSVGLSVWGSISAVTSEVQNRLGTSFVLKSPARYPEDPAYYDTVTRWDGSAGKTYAGPKLDADLVDQILQIDGVCNAYNGEWTSWVCVEDLDLIPGAQQYYIEYYSARPGAIEEIDAYDPYGGWDSYEIGIYETRLCSHSDTALYDKFRSGAFELIDGRHVTPSDRQKVLISDELAKRNDLQVGDHIKVTLRGTNLGIWEDVKKVFGEMELEIVGLFHVNGYQPTGDNVHEDLITYNWLLADEDTNRKLSAMWDRGAYQDYISDFGYENLTFFVNDPKQLEQVVEEVKRLDHAAMDVYELSLDDTMYKSTVEPLKSIRSVVTGLTLAIIAGCVIVLLIVFTMWVRSRRQEAAVYLSLGIGKAKILGQFMLEAVIVAAVALAVALPVSVPVSNAVGNHMLAASIEEAQPEGPKEYSQEELRQAAYAGRMSELFAYENSSYGGPERIDFSLGLKEILLLIALELLIIAAAVCKGGWFLVTLEPRKIMTMMS